jgi:hypothetical protein
MVVAPAHVLRYRLFSSVAIVSSLVLYGVELFAAARVRRLISPWRVIGATAAQGWKTLGRWIAAAQSQTLLPFVRPLLGRSLRWHPLPFTFSLSPTKPWPVRCTR